MGLRNSKASKAIVTSGEKLTYGNMMKSASNENSIDQENVVLKKCSNLTCACDPCACDVKCSCDERRLSAPDATKQIGHEAQQFIEKVTSTVSRERSEIVGSAPKSAEITQGDIQALTPEQELAEKVERTSLNNTLNKETINGSKSEETRDLLEMPSNAQAEPRFINTSEELSRPQDATHQEASIETSAQVASHTLTDQLSNEPSLNSTISNDHSKTDVVNSHHKDVESTQEQPRCNESQKEDVSIAEVNGKDGSEIEERRAPTKEWNGEDKLTEAREKIEITNLDGEGGTDTEETFRCGVPREMLDEPCKNTTCQDDCAPACAIEAVQESNLMEVVSLENE